MKNLMESDDLEELMDDYELELSKKIIKFTKINED